MTSPGFVLRFLLHWAVLTLIIKYSNQEIALLIHFGYNGRRAKSFGEDEIELALDILESSASLIYTKWFLSQGWAR